MTTFLLDTTVLAAYFNRRQPAVAMIDALPDGSVVAASILSYGEVFEYLLRNPDARPKADRLRSLFQSFAPATLDFAIVERYALLRRQMRLNRDGLIGDVDTLLAATALELDFVLVTTDGDFVRAPGLRLRLLRTKSFELILQRD